MVIGTLKLKKILTLTHCQSVTCTATDNLTGTIKRQNTKITQKQRDKIKTALVHSKTQKHTQEKPGIS